jgi:hypothetical protein
MNLFLSTHGQAKCHCDYRANSLATHHKRQ